MVVISSFQFRCSFRFCEMNNDEEIIFSFFPLFLRENGRAKKLFKEKVSWLAGERTFRHSFFKKRTCTRRKQQEKTATFGGSRKTPTGTDLR